MPDESDLPPSLDPRSPDGSGNVWPPPPTEGAKQRPSLAIGPPPTVNVIFAGIAGFSIVGLGTFFFFLGPIIVLGLFLSYRVRQPAIAWALAIGGIVALAGIGTCFGLLYYR
jgi:hypothetical protein